VLYLSLVSGAGGFLVGAIQWATIIFFVEVTRLSGNPLTKQEATVIYLGSFLGYTATWQIGWIYNAYYKYSPVAQSLGLSDQVPYFGAPASETAWTLRTFLHPSWTPVFAVFIISFAASWFASLTMGFLGRQLYIIEENLPFPLAQPGAQMVTALTERQSSRLRVVAVSAVIGMFYALNVYGAPMVLPPLGIAYPALIPAGWADFNIILHQYLPGASFGVATDITIFASGLVIPLPFTISLFIGSFASQFIGNYILVRDKITTFGESWFPGLSVGMSFSRSFIYAWVAPIMGLAIGAGLTPIIRRPKLIIDTFKALSRGSRAAGGTPIWALLIPYIAGAAAMVVLGYYLSPDLPIWVLLLLNAIWPFLLNLIADRAAGVSMSFDVPYTRELSFIGSGYTGINAWFTPTYSRTAWVANFKICQLTETDPISLVKALALVLPISILAGFFFLADFWRLAPMPSTIYGATLGWPIEATYRSIWIMHPPGIFRPEWIVAGFAVAAAAFIALDFVHLGGTVISAASGFASPIPVTFTILMGSIFGLIMSRAIGKDWWRQNAALIAGGISVGEGIIVVLGATIVLIVRSMWWIPF